MCQLAQMAGVNGIRVQEGTKAVGNKTDRQGAQLSQECPLPANYQPMGTNNCMAQCPCLQCSRLFRLDSAVGVVSGPAKSFHFGRDLLQPAEVTFGLGVWRFGLWIRLPRGRHAGLRWYSVPTCHLRY